MTDMFVPGSYINVEAMRREARKRAKRDGRRTVIHHHAVDESCAMDDEYHEVYGDG